MYVKKYLRQELLCLRYEIEKTKQVDMYCE